MGEPASEINETTLLDLINSSICICFLLKSWSVYFSIFAFLISKCLNSLRLCFVFSQRITSDFFKMLIALSVISSKLPMGVATIYKPDFIES